MNAKQAAAEKAAMQIQDGMIVGLGTGTTATFAITEIAARVKNGLNIQAVASSKKSEDLARASGIYITDFTAFETIDVYIDGADEVDRHFNLTKGGGGALLRVKILACNSKRFVVIVDDSKLVSTLGHFPLPVEIVPFAAAFTIRKIQKLGCVPQLRMAQGAPYITDNGNYILDCAFKAIENPEQLNMQLHLIAGVVECGLFPAAMVNQVIVGYEDGSAKSLS